MSQVNNLEQMSNQTLLEQSQILPVEQVQSVDQSSDGTTSVIVVEPTKVEVAEPTKVEVAEPTKVEVKVDAVESTKKEYIKKPVSFESIGLDVVNFKRTFCRNRGTLSQLVKSFIDMKERLSTPLNPYQSGLYPFIQSESQKVIDIYTTILSSVVPTDNYVFGYYINGPYNDGKRKPTTTYHEKKSYAFSEYKETLKSINDRLRHIKIDCQRKLKEKTRNNLPIFERVIIFCDTYHQIINSCIASWDTFIAEYRKANNIDKPAPVIRNRNKTKAKFVKSQNNKFKHIQKQTEHYTEPINELRSKQSKRSKPNTRPNSRPNSLQQKNKNLSSNVQNTPIVNDVTDTSDIILNSIQKKIVSNQDNSEKKPHRKYGKKNNNSISTVQNSVELPVNSI